MRPSFLQPSLEISRPAPGRQQHDLRKKKADASSSEESVGGDSDAEKNADLDPKSLRLSLKRY